MKKQGKENVFQREERKKLKEKEGKGVFRKESQDADVRGGGLVPKGKEEKGPGATRKGGLEENSHYKGSIQKKRGMRREKLREQKGGKRKLSTKKEGNRKPREKERKSGPIPREVKKKAFPLRGEYPVRAMFSLSSPSSIGHAQNCRRKGRGGARVRIQLDSGHRPAT